LILLIGSLQVAFTFMVAKGLLYDIPLTFRKVGLFLASGCAGFLLLFFWWCYVCVEALALPARELSDPGGTMWDGSTDD